MGNVSKEERGTLPGIRSKREKRECCCLHNLPDFFNQDSLDIKNSVFYNFKKKSIF